jgi:hypothetical protein
MKKIESKSSHPLCSTRYSSHLFVCLFSNISKTVFSPSHVLFCREFQALSSDNKKCFNQRSNRGEISTVEFFIRYLLEYYKYMERKLVKFVRDYLCALRVKPTIFYYKRKMHSFSPLRSVDMVAVIPLNVQGVLLCI